MTEPVPSSYMTQWRGLFVREGDRIVDAPEADAALARSYPSWPEKGALVDGKRLTLMTAKKTYAVGESARVLHIVDYTLPGSEVPIMGPKAVQGEYIDNKLVTSPAPSEDPLTPGMYDGATLRSPALDYNYEITVYKFDQPGTHTIHWQLGALRSNTLQLEVRP